MLLRDAQTFFVERLEDEELGLVFDYRTFVDQLLPVSNLLRVVIMHVVVSSCVDYVMDKIKRVDLQSAC